MKKLLLLAVLGIAIVSCNSTKTEEIERLKDENESLNQEMAVKDSTLNLFEESFTSIQTNLSLINQRERDIELNVGELKEGKDTRDEITQDIQAINNLLNENKNTISHLNNQLEAYGAESESMTQMLTQLTEDIETKEEEISYLKENLTAANFTIEILNEMLDSAEFRNEIQGDIIQMQANELNTAYYAIGTFKELKENGVLEKDGSIIGIGGTKQLKEDFNNDYFAQIDITQATSIPLNSTKVKVVTNHDAKTYELEGEELKTLKITDPFGFWSTSKYLVVITD